LIKNLFIYKMNQRMYQQLIEILGNIKENNSIKVNKNEFHNLSNNNAEKIYSKYSLDELLEFIKKEFEKSNDENDKDKNIMINLIMPIFQRHNRYYTILQQLFITKSTIKEIETFQFSQKNLTKKKLKLKNV